MKNFSGKTGEWKFVLHSHISLSPFAKNHWIASTFFDGEECPPLGAYQIDAIADSIEKRYASDSLAMHLKAKLRARRSMRQSLEKGQKGKGGTS